METLRVNQVEAFIKICFQKHEARLLSNNQFREELSTLSTLQHKLTTNVINHLIVSKEYAIQCVAHCNMFLSQLSDFEDIMFYEETTTSSGITIDHLVENNLDYTDAESLVFGNPERTLEEVNACNAYCNLKLKKKKTPKNFLKASLLEYEGPIGDGMLTYV